MLSNPAGVQALDNVREFVHHFICVHNDLEAASAAITERVLLRGGKPCGLLFCVQGPRNVKFTAIWAQDQNTVIFYDSAGQRMNQTKVPARHAANKRTLRAAA